MEQPLLEILIAWAIRNPALVAALLGPLSVAIVWVLATARRAAPMPAPRAESAPLPQSEAAPAEALEPVQTASPPLEPVATPVPGVAPPPEAAARVEPEAAAPAAPPPARLRDRLKLTSESLVGRIGSLLGGRTVDSQVLEDLEAMLFQADLGVKTADSLLDEVRSKASGGDVDAVRGVLRESILAKLRRVQPDFGLRVGGSPHVILVLGVNGAGKTTSIGKLAARYRSEGHSVILGAADTFRAAAIEQLQTWGERAGCEVIAGRSGGDPAAVAYDTVAAAKARAVDVAIIDTAGRLQTRAPLMEELGKMVRVIGKGLDGAPHEVLLVLDATTGQNAISQARLFTEVAGVTGLILTKLDGTAKGGVLIGLADEFGIPVRFVGVGESVPDLREFDAEEFVDAVFAD